MKLSVVLSTHAARFEAATLKGDLRDNLARIAAWGYDGVELAIRDPRLVDADELASSLASNKLLVPAIGTGQAWGEERLSFTDPKPEVRAAAVARLTSHVPLAARLGAVIVVGLLRGVAQAGVSGDQANEWIVAALAEGSEFAAKAGIRLALEPINRYETPFANTVDEGLELIRRVGAPNLGLLLDTFHMNVEEPSIEESIRAAADHIFHFHVADSNRWYPGAGHLDFASILATLSSAGYRGFVCGEFLPRPDAQTAAMRSISHLRPLLSQLSR